MLDERDRGQADNLRHLKRIATRVLWTIAAVIVLGLMGIKETRELLVSLFQDPPPKPQVAAKPAMPAKLDEEALKKVGDMVSKASGGQTLEKGDIEFGMELLNFMQDPPKKDPAAQKTAERTK